MLAQQLLTVLYTGSGAPHQVATLYVQVFVGVGIRVEVEVEVGGGVGVGIGVTMVVWFEVSVAHSRNRVVRTGAKAPGVLYQFASGSPKHFPTVTAV